MIHLQKYHSPLGMLLLASDQEGLVGCWFEDQQYYAAGIKDQPSQEVSDPILQAAVEWLDQYFAGKHPDTDTVSLTAHVTEFRQRVLQALQAVGEGQTISYRELAAQVVGQANANRYARAVAGAVGHNPLSLFIPCHRVVGSDGALTGYAGGLWRKEALLKFEQQSQPRD
ncbi:6-O-methylguanine DNA methyltransferase [Ligilactobacillus pabuli]|uniref:6-O-methylguanine DNA methyltransferase n=1 Tax=Ligilactobacillus pabuli TaxID=2886039 RepID=A0ABQ5JHU6_9LACO|nr:methylated-DNA--[protein]-cysteine S-methyltransferase [Ligilactobacillus pabuli]GKS81574.1 6-O-methylguanine DNA methyltransferase [Ligilactobacillus pabuli]HIW88921.1 methylated-DNA--[protein]-cysteine S-methyltransferase [Candidatus Ligilactobacillus excrementipullorum]